MATPTVAAMRRCGSRVAASDITTNVTCPGSSRFIPCDRERMRHLGGKMLETRTRLQAAIPAERSASSKEVSFSRCFPTPLVKNISFGTNPTTSTLLDFSHHAHPDKSECMVNTKFPTVKEPSPPYARIIIRSPKQMTREQARETARDILQIIPAVMPTLSAPTPLGGE